MAHLTALHCSAKTGRGCLLIFPDEVESQGILSWLDFQSCKTKFQIQLNLSLLASAVSLISANVSPEIQTGAPALKSNVSLHWRFSGGGGKERALLQFLLMNEVSASSTSFLSSCSNGPKTEQLLNAFSLSPLYFFSPPKIPAAPLLPYFPFPSLFQLCQLPSPFCVFSPFLLALCSSVCRSI